MEAYALGVFKTLQQKGLSKKAALESMETDLANLVPALKEAGWTNEAIRQRFVENTSTIRIALEEVYKIDLHENHYVLHRFFMEVGGTLIIRYQNESIHDAWIIEMDGNYYDEKGMLSKISATGPVIENVPLIDFHLSETTQGIYERTFQSLNTLYFGITKAITESVNRELESMFGPIRSFSEQYEGRVYLLQDPTKILRLFNSAELFSSIEDTLQIHQHLSAEGIAPKIHHSGILTSKVDGQPFLYIVMDYIPLTLHDILDPVEKAFAISEAIKLCYRIEALGYYNIDNHGGNFLYDSKSHRVYAIDFAQLTRVPTERNRFKGRLHDFR